MRHYDAAVTGSPLIITFHLACRAYRTRRRHGRLARADAYIRLAASAPLGLLLRHAFTRFIFHISERLPR